MQPPARVPAPEWGSLEAWRLWIDLGLHAVLLGVAVSPFIILYRRRHQPKGMIDILVLLAALLALPFGCGFLIARFPTYWRPFVVGYAVLCSVVLFSSIVISLIQMKRDGHGSFAFRIVISLIPLGILILLMLPAVPSAREAARRMQCSVNLRTLATQLLESPLTGPLHDQFLPNNKPNSSNAPDMSWRVHLLPQLEYVGLRERYLDLEVWNSTANQSLSRMAITVYTCPSEPPLFSPEGYRFTSYAMLRNSDLRPSNPRLLARTAKPEEIPRRILLVEACSSNIVWTEPRDVDIDQMQVTQRLDAVSAPWKSKNFMSSWHGSGSNVAFGDGSIRFFGANVDGKVLEQMVQGSPWVHEELE